MTRARRAPRRPEDQGQASVELALLLPVVVLLLLAVLQVGLLARDAVLVTHASREAVRAAAVDPNAGAARAAATSSSGLSADRLSVVVRGRDGPGGRVRVALTYRAQRPFPSWVASSATGPYAARPPCASRPRPRRHEGTGPGTSPGHVEGSSLAWSR